MTFLVALVAYMFWVFPSPYEWIVPLIERWRPVGFVGQAWKALNLPTVLTGLVVVALAAMGFFLALWAATTVYRLAPARPARWHRPAAARGGRVEPSPPALPLGGYDRIGIILAGGGAKGAYQAGALDALHRFLSEREALGSVRMIAATSIGAWNACFWLADMIGIDGGPCETWWHRLRLSEIVAPTYYLPRARNYVVSAAPWRGAFHALFRDDPRARARLLRHLEIPHAAGNLRFYLTRTNVERAHLEFSTNREDLLDTDNASGRRRPLAPPDRWTRARTIDDLERAVFASMDLPPLFEYTRFGEELFEDGGVVENLPIYFGTGIEKCDLLFVFPLNASFVAPASIRSLLYRLQRVMAIRQGALERKALKDVYLYNELAVLRDRLDRADIPSPPASKEPVPTPARSEEALLESSRQTLLQRASVRVHRPVQVFAICPDEPLEIDTIEFWKTNAAGRAYRLMREYTRYELEKFDFNASPNWIRVSLVNPQGEIRYLEDF
ncbi:MAG: patatin-like phospholipase family protein [Gemmatimonadota bacterium]